MNIAISRGRLHESHYGAAAAFWQGMDLAVAQNPRRNSVLSIHSGSYLLGIRHEVPGPNVVAEAETTVRVRHHVLY